jgi:cold shock CspA family protein
MPSAVLKTFDPTKGFGTMLLESGEELTFDISASNKREPRIGDRAEVTMGVGWKGQPKAKLVVFELEEDRAPTFTKGVGQLRDLGFLRGWDAKHTRAAARELFNEVPEKLVRAAAGALLQHYYGEGISDRGRAEGVITLDWRYGQVTRQPIVDICALSPDEISVQHELGDSLLPLLAAINDKLGESSSLYRFFSLDVEGDFYVIVCRPHDFDAKIVATGWLKLGDVR